MGRLIGGLTMEFLRWFEHFFIIPFRWFRLHYQAWKNQQQRCKVCGYRDKFDFHVDDETWHKIVPPKYQERVVCLACFDDFAKEKDINYEVQLICFAGNKESISFSVDRHVNLQHIAEVES